MNMDWQRTILIAGMGLVAWMLVIQWNQFQDQDLVVQPSYSETQSNYGSELESVAGITSPQNSEELPQLESMPQSSASLDLAQPSSNRNLITAKNDVIEIVIDPSIRSPRMGDNRFQFCKIAETIFILLEAVLLVLVGPTLQKGGPNSLLRTVIIF